MPSLTHYAVTGGAVPSERFGVTAVPSSVIEDNTLTFDARGLYAFIASYATPVSFDRMVACTADGPRTTRVALEELMARGLVHEVVGQ